MSNLARLRRRLTTPDLPVESPMRTWLRTQQQDAINEAADAQVLGDTIAQIGALTDLKTLSWLLTSLDRLEFDGEPDDHAYAEWYATNAEPSGFSID